MVKSSLSGSSLRRRCGDAIRIPACLCPSGGTSSVSSVTRNGRPAHFLRCDFEPASPGTAGCASTCPTCRPRSRDSLCKARQASQRNKLAPAFISSAKISFVHTSPSARARKGLGMALTVTLIVVLALLLYRIWRWLWHIATFLALALFLYLAWPWLSQMRSDDALMSWLQQARLPQALASSAPSGRPYVSPQRYAAPQRTHEFVRSFRSAQPGELSARLSETVSLCRKLARARYLPLERKALVFGS